MLAVVCLLAGCATQSLTVSVDGAVELTVNASDLEKAYKAATQAFPTIEGICENGLEMPGHRPVPFIDDIGKVFAAFGQLRDLVNAQTLTLKGRCLPAESAESVN